MNSEPTIQAMIEKQALAWKQEDVSSIVEDFAPNAIFIAGGYTFQGIEAIQQSAEAYFNQHRD